MPNLIKYTKNNTTIRLHKKTCGNYIFIVEGDHVMTRLVAQEMKIADVPKSGMDQVIKEMFHFINENQI